jgi:transcription termination factor Rho
VLPLKYTDLESKTMVELYKIAKELELPGYYKLRKKELIFEILKTQTEKTGFLYAKGVLEILPDGYGFLRPFQYLPSNDDIYVSLSQIRRFDMRTATCSRTGAAPQGQRTVFRPAAGRADKWRGPGTGFRKAAL